LNKVWKELKKESLMKIVVQVLSREGLNDLTMDTVAREAGVAKGTLYTYFRNKQDLVREAIDISIAPMLEELNTILKSKLSPDQKLRKMTLRHLSYFETHRDFFSIFVHDRHNEQRRLKRYRSHHYQDFLERVASVIRDGIRAKTFRDLDSRKIAAMLVESNISIISQRLLSDDPAPVERDAALITDVFLNGIQRSA
jgi:TetR/AcrR family transcriptional regulator, fatty acid metabolism regulator protein